MREAITDPDEAPSRPAEMYRSRAGDFFFAGVLAGITLLGAVMLSDLAPVAAGGLGLACAAGLFLRYYSLREAMPVAPGVTFNEEQLQKFERLRAVLNALPQPVMLLDERDHVELSNPACEAVFGVDVSGKHVSAMIRAPAALSTLPAARASRVHQEAEFVLPGPTERACLFYAAPLLAGRPADEGRLIVMVRDRTAQKKLEKMRTDFIANASHELRTPLASMLGFIETIQNHAKDDPAAQERFLRVMQAQAERMLRLVKDLMNLSAIELSEAQTPGEVVDLAAVATSVCEMMHPIAAGMPDSRIHAVTDGPTMITADRDEVFQVIQNLVDNAMKYGGDAPEVSVTVGRGDPPLWGGARTGDTAALVSARLDVPVESLPWVQVCDGGEGISRAALPRLTERFYRTDPETSRAKGGTGLGLAIVKHAVQRHRGGIQIESEQGRGSAFTCFFPPAAVVEKQRSAQASHERVPLDKRTERA